MTATPVSPAQAVQAARNPLRADPSRSTVWISWLRVVAITGVVAIHTTGATAIQADARSTPEGILAIALNRGANIAVPLFVLVSGALLLDPARYPGDGPFLRKRAARLLPAIVFWHLFYWELRVTLLGQSVPPLTALANTLNGRLFTALYFFWIVLGLALISPFLVAWLRTASRRAAVIAGFGLMLVPGLTAATAHLRGAPLTWVETPWTWWLPYVGLYVLGWALRGLTLRAWQAILCVVLPMAVLALIAGTFGVAEQPGWFRAWFTGYYSLGVQVTAAMVFLAYQALLTPTGALGFATRGRPARVARTLGDATMGIFAAHLAVLYVSYRLPGIAGDAPAQTLRELIGRTAFVLVATTALVLIGRRIPVVRRVL